MSEVVQRVDAPWLRDGDVARVLALLDADGEEARIVGGAVRNLLLGLPHGDIDIATTASPQEVMRRAAAAGVKCAPTGVEHGTVTLVLGHHPFEVTTLREDVETFGRKAKVVFGRDWRRDAERRDFTINGLSLDRTGLIHDWVGGLADIAARRVRFIGDADRRIAEDYLRILRFFRFHAGYGAGAPDEEAYRACVRGREGLAGLSAERIRIELLKLMGAARAAEAIEAMVDGGLLSPVLAGVPYRATLQRMATLEAALALPADAIRRLAALGVAVAEDAERLTQRLRLSNAEAKRLAVMAKGWRRVSACDEASKVAIYRLGPEAYLDCVMLAAARGAVAEDDLRRLVALARGWSAPAFPLKAADFIARGIAPGPALGATLARAEEAWLARAMPLDAAALDAIARAAVGAAKT